MSKFDIKNKVVYRETIRKSLGIDSSAFVFGFVGRITKDKGINELYKSFKKVLLNNKNCYLIMVGQNEGDSTIEKDLSQWSKESKNVIFTGYTNVVEQYLSAMDCYILPSYREGFGMGVVEAEAMGLPVIVTNIPGPIDAMKDGETGIIVDKANDKVLYDAMILLVNNDSLRKRMGEKGVIFVTNNFEQNILFSKILEDRKMLLNK